MSYNNHIYFFVVFSIPLFRVGFTSSLIQVTIITLCFSVKKEKKWNRALDTSFFSLTVIDASAAVTLLEQRPEKIQALSGIRTHDLCDASAVLSQLSCQSHMRAIVCGLAL